MLLEETIRKYQFSLDDDRNSSSIGRQRKRAKIRVSQYSRLVFVQSVRRIIMDYAIRQSKKDPRVSNDTADNQYQYDNFSLIISLVACNAQMAHIDLKKYPHFQRTLVYDLSHDDDANIRTPQQLISLWRKPLILEARGLLERWCFPVNRRRDRLGRRMEIPRPIDGEKSAHQSGNYCKAMATLWCFGAGSVATTSCVASLIVFPFPGVSCMRVRLVAINVLFTLSF